MIRRGGVVAASLLAGALYSFSPAVAHADLTASQQIYVTKLKDTNASVRASAAISLGSANDDGAVSPLCTALSDSDDTVRISAATSLKKLGDRAGSSDCLKARLSVEPSSTVKSSIQKAIDAMSGGGGTDVIKDNPNAKYYVSIAVSGTKSSDVEQLVIKSVKAKLDEAGTVQLAPKTESADSARSTIKNKKLKGGFYLAIAVETSSADGGLKVKCRIGVFNYPNKSLLGNVDKSLSSPGASAGDKDTENRLMDLAAGLATKQFTDNASAFL